jgi:hypothetical protein
LPLARLKELRQIPLLLSVRATESLDQWQLREDERLLHTAGVPYTLQQHSLQACPGEGDRSRMLAELDRWIMSHVCGAPCRHHVCR